MTPQQTLSFTLANGLATQLITLAVAMIGLTVTFAKDFQQNTLASRLLLIFIWIFLFSSIVVGIFDIKALITVLAPQKSSDSVIGFSNDVLTSATLQELFFFLGLLLFIIQGVKIVLAPKEKK